MVIIKNTAAKAFIIPFMPELTGLVAPGDTIEGVPAEALGCDFIKGCVERGEMFIVDDTCDIDEVDLAEMAEQLGIKVDKRWSEERLKAEIAQAQAQ